MENFKYVLFSIVVIGLFAFVGYWAFSSIESGSSHIDNQKLKELTDQNEKLKNDISDLKNQVTILQSQVEDQTTQVTESNTSSSSEVSSSSSSSNNSDASNETTTYKYQSLIDDLQKIINAHVVMKRGSQGTRVGTVQKFLNIYNGTSNRIDNDYGKTTEANVKTFQKDQGLTSDGEAGPGTFRKMISWLKTK